MSDIDLPTLVQRIRVDTSDLDRAEKIAKAFGGKLDAELGSAGDAADHFAAKAHEAADSSGKLGDANDDTKAKTLGAAAAIAQLGDSTRRTTAAVQGAQAATRAAAGDSDALRVARLRLAVASNDVASAETRLNSARDSGKLDEVTRGESRLAEAILRRARAEQEVRSVGGRGNDAGPLRELANAADKAGNATSFLGRMLTSLKVPAITAAITTLTGGIAALAAAAISAVGQLGPLVGVLGSLPAAIGAIGSVKGVFSGLLKGPAEAASAVTKAAGATSSAGRSIKQTQQAVADASRRAAETQVRGSEAVSDARRREADTIESAAESVVRAEENLARAQRDSKRAQEDLTRARDDAREKLQDMALSVRQAALDEEAGRIALAKARERLDQAQAGGNPRDIQEADLAYRQATLTLDTIIERNDDLATEAKKAAKQGVDGADNVVAAQQNVTDTQAAQAQAAKDLAKTQRDAARSVADAQRDLARTIRDTAQANADAQRAVAQARDSAAAAGGGGQSAVDAMKDLTPEARKFAEALVGVRKDMDGIKRDAQRVALPGFTAGLLSAKALLPSVRSGYLGVAAVLGKTAEETGALAKEGPFSRKFAGVVASNTRIVGSLGSAVAPLIKALVNVAYAARRMSESFAKAFADGAKKLSVMSEDGPRLERFFDRTTKLVFQLGRTFRDLGIGLKNVFGIGARDGVQFVDLMERGAARFRRFTESAGGKNKISQFFKDTKPAIEEMGRLVRDVLKMFGHFATSKELAPLLKQIRTELVPAMQRLGDAIGKNVAPTLIKLATAFLDFQGVLSFSPIIAVANALAELVIGITKVVDAVPGLATVVATLIAFNTALKGVAVAGKITGITGLATSMGKVGPAGAAGQKGLAGFIQGLRGVDKAGNAAAGKSQSIANLIGGSFRGLASKTKSLGGKIASGIGSGISASKSIATSAARAVGSATSAVARAGASAGAAAGRGIASGLSAATSGIGGALSKLGPVLAAARGGLIAAAGAARAFTLALLTNPIFLIIAALVALGVGLVELYKHSETFRDIVNASWRAVQTVVGGVIKVLMLYVKTLITFWGGFIKGGMAIISGTFRAAWTLISGIVTVAFKGIIAIVKLYFGLIRLAVTTALAVVKALFTGDFGKIPGILGNALKGVWTIFKNFGKDVLDNLGDLGKVLFNAGKQLIQGLIDGIKSIGSGVKDAIGGVLGPAKRFLPGSPIKDGPLKGWNGGRPGKALMQLVADGILAGGPRVNAAMQAALRDVEAYANGSYTPSLTVPEVSIPQPPVPPRPGAGGGTAGGGTTIDNSRHYDVDVHETTGPTTTSSLTRRLRALDTYGHGALAGRTP